MTLRRALAALPDDRDTRAAARQVMDLLDRHHLEDFDAARVHKATGLSLARVEPVLAALARAFVIDCDGDPRLDRFHYVPDGVLDVEVRQFLRGGGASADLQRRVDRFRGRHDAAR